MRTAVQLVVMGLALLFYCRKCWLKATGAHRRAQWPAHVVMSAVHGWWVALATPK